MKNNIETQYLDLLDDLLDNGIKKSNRTGTDTLSLFSRTLRHDMSEGFPLLTTKKMPFKTMTVELEGFIQGITSKKWFQDRGCHIWDEWCNPQKVTYGEKERMKAEDDLGPCIYGASWRNFHDPATMAVPDFNNVGWKDVVPSQGIDQLANIVDTLKENPEDRRMVCMAWNPMGLDHTALPPCHMGFFVNVLDGKLNLSWWQRSADTFLGVPFNIASYGLLLHLLAKEAGLEEGELVGHFEDVHLYVNHTEQALKQIDRRSDMYKLPNIKTSKGSIFDWKHTKTKLVNYKSHDVIKAVVAV